MDKAMVIIGKLAEALRVPAEQVWAALVAKQVIGSAAIAANLLICLTLCGVLAIVLAKSWKRYKAEKDKNKYSLETSSYEIATGTSAIALVILSLVTFLSGTANMESMLTGFFAPEAGAVLEILSKLGK